MNEGLSNAVKRYVNGRESRVARLRALSNIQSQMNRIIKGWNSNQVNQTARIRVGPSSLNTVKQKLTTLAQRVKGIKVPDRFLAFIRRAKANIAAGNAQAAAANTNKAAAEVGLPPPLPPKPNSMRVPTNNNKVNNKAAAASNWLRNLGNPTNNNKVNNKAAVASNSLRNLGNPTNNKVNNKAASASNSKRQNNANNAKREMNRIPNFNIK